MVTADTVRAVITAMESLQVSDYSDTPPSWDRERRYFNEGARAAAQLLARFLDAAERNEESARAKRLVRYFGVV